MMMFKSKKRRYPGTKPFTRDQASLFFGRSDDIKRLNELIALESVVVVYGKSGYGKSSLINAGLLPQLEENSKNICLMPRFNAWKDNDSISPLSKTREAIKELEKNYEILDKVLEDDDTLWRKLKAFQIAHPDKRLHLFFDQFEELFTYPASQINEFKMQVAELVRRQVPRRYERALDLKGADGDEVLSYEEEDRLYQNLNLRMVFIIRSDKMHLLDQLSDYIPKILRNNYEIKALNKPSATEALIAPALLEGNDYITPPFRYDKSAQEKVLDFLEDDNSGLVEAIQLQILATSFEDKVHKDQLEILDSDNIGDLESIVKNYYNDRLRSIGNYEEIALASKMIEEGLVDKERHQRLTLHEGQIRSIYEVEEDLLNKLVENHLLRRQPDSRSGYNYELSHDTLIAPVLAARTIREQKEAEEEHLNTQRQLAKEKGRRRKATIIAGFAIIASIIAGITAISAWRNYKALNTTQAQLDKREAEIFQGKIIQDSLTDQASILKSEAEEALKAAAKDSIRATQLLLVAQEADRNAQEALISAMAAQKAQRIAEIERQKSFEAFLDEVKRGDTLKLSISGGETNLNYQVDFLMEEGYDQIANENFQAALTSFSNAKFIFRDTVSFYSIDEIDEQVRLSSQANKVEKEFKRGQLYSAKDKYYDLENDFRIMAPLWTKRLDQIESSIAEFDKNIEEGLLIFDKLENINSLIFVPDFDSPGLVTWPIYRNRDLKNLRSVIFYDTGSELYLEGLPIEVDTIMIFNSDLEMVPTIDFLNEVEYLRIEGCHNLRELSSEILKYDMLETLVLKDNPAIESVPFNWKDIDLLEHIELSGNHNLIFVLTGYSEAYDSDYNEQIEEYVVPIKTLVLKDIFFDPDIPIMGIEKQFSNKNELYDFWAEFEFGGYVLDVYDSLRSLTIDNIFLDDLDAQGFDFTYWKALEELKLKDLKNTNYLDFEGPINNNLSKLHLESMPINNEVNSIISQNPNVIHLTLKDLPALSGKLDLKDLSDVEHIHLENLPNIEIDFNTPSEFIRLKSLTLKGLSSTIDVNKILTFLPNLENLVIDDINLNDQVRLDQATLSNLKSLKINNCENSELLINPLALVNLEKLELFNLEGLMSKKSWLDSLQVLKSLKTLGITTEHPEFLNEMKNLLELTLEYPTGDFPQVFNSEMNLEKLIIRNTYSKKLPSTIASLSNLKKFYLSGTSVTSIEELSSLGKLEEIYLENNSQLYNLPNDMTGLSNLRKIVYFNTFRNTAIRQLQENIGNIKLIRVNSLREFQKEINDF